MLYPYRASAQKNQLRWQFGVLAPGRFTETRPSESSSIRSELVVETDRGDPPPGAGPRPAGPGARRRRGGRGDVQAGADARRRRAGVDHFDEAVEHQIDVVDIDRSRSPGSPAVLDVEFAGGEEEQRIVAADGTSAGRVVRRRWNRSRPG